MIDILEIDNSISVLLKNQCYWVSDGVKTFLSISNTRNTVLGESSYKISYDDNGEYYYIYLQLTESSVLRFRGDSYLELDMELDETLYGYISEGIDPEEALKLLDL
jgi:hypothetical protein